MKKILIFLMFVMFSNVVFGMNLTTDMKAYWSHDTDATDDWGSFNGATSGETHTDNCKLGGCYLYDNRLAGQNGISVGIVVPTGDFTLCSWMYEMDDNLTAVHNWYSWYNNDGSPGRGGAAFYVDATVDEKIEEMRYYSTNDQANVGVDIPFDTWFHHCLIREGSNLKTYIDGQLIATNGSMTQAPYQYNNYIGGHSGLSNRWFGFLDEIFVSGRAFNDTEVESVYFNGDGCNIIENPSGCVVEEPIIEEEVTESSNHGNAIAVAQNIAKASSAKASAPTNPITQFILNLRSAILKALGIKG